jgi:hypothetical protein
MTAARRPVRPDVAREIDDQTHLGEIYMHALLRSQLRLGLTVCGVVAVVLGGLPLLFAVEPALRTVRVVGIPLPWLLLGVLVYPALIGEAWVYTRLAERNERDFTELVERS